MSNSGIPDEVKKFIIEKIDTIGQLEVLLLLYRTRAKRWTPKAVGEELRSSEEGAGKHLESLHVRKLISKESGPEGDLVFYYAVLPELDQIVASLQPYYDSYKVTVISLIYDKSNDILRSFSNAFKFKKES